MNAARYTRRSGRMDIHSQGIGPSRVYSRGHSPTRPRMNSSAGVAGVGVSGSPSGCPLPAVPLSASRGRCSQCLGVLVEEVGLLAGEQLEGASESELDHLIDPLVIDVLGR